MELPAGGQMKIIAGNSGKFILVPASFAPGDRCRFLKTVRKES